jgi:hypothetical protein
MKKRRAFNRKRKLISAPDALVRGGELRALADQVRYGGNPEHKRNPGDFGLTPPSLPRSGKSFCDDAGIFTRAEALALLKQGLCRGLISQRMNGQWPQNIWAVTENGIPLEAEYELPGVYHGYPMPETDVFRRNVIRRWGAQ